MFNYHIEYEATNGHKYFIYQVKKGCNVHVENDTYTWLGMYGGNDYGFSWRGSVESSLRREFEDVVKRIIKLTAIL